MSSMARRFPYVLGVDWKVLLEGRSSCTMESSSGATPSSTNSSLSTAISFLLGAPNRTAAFSLFPLLHHFRTGQLSSSYSSSLSLVETGFKPIIRAAISLLGGLIGLMVVIPSSSSTQDQRALGTAPEVVSLFRGSPLLTS
jgi:hypothetical protein